MGCSVRKLCKLGHSHCLGLGGPSERDWAVAVRSTQMAQTRQSGLVMTTKTEDNVVEKLEKALRKHTNADGTMGGNSLGSFMDALMSDPDVIDAAKDIAEFVDETNEETIEHWKKVGEEDEHKSD